MAGVVGTGARGMTRLDPSGALAFAAVIIIALVIAVWGWLTPTGFPCMSDGPRRRT